jgi:Zn-dependent protease with chaperone function
MSARDPQPAPAAPTAAAPPGDGLAHWQRLLDEFKAQDTSLARLRLRVDTAQPLKAAINGQVLVLGTAMLEAPPPVRLYVLAHELGHRRCRHEAWFWAAVACSAGVGLAVALLLRPWLVGPVLGVLACGLAFSGYVLLKTRTLLLEWQADAAGAALLERRHPGEGVARMLAGMAQTQAMRVAHEPDQAGYHASYYGSKALRLQGRPARCWIPR